MANKIFPYDSNEIKTIEDRFDLYIENISHDIKATIVDTSNEIYDELLKFYDRYKLIFDGDALGNDLQRERINSIVYSQLKDIIDNSKSHTPAQINIAKSYMKRSGITPDMVKAVGPYRDRINLLKSVLLESLSVRGITINDNIIKDIYVHGDNYTNIYNSTIAVLINGYDKVRAHLTTPASPSLANIFKEIDNLVPKLFIISEDKMASFLQMYNGLMILCILAKKSNDNNFIMHSKNVKASKDILDKHHSEIKQRRTAISAMPIRGYKHNLEDIIRKITTRHTPILPTAGSDPLYKINITNVYFILLITILLYIILTYYHIHLPIWLYAFITFVSTSLSL